MKTDLRQRLDDLREQLAESKARPMKSWIDLETPNWLRHEICLLELRIQREERENAA